MSAFTEANRQAFENLSAGYDSKPWQKKISQQVADALQERKEWIGARWIESKEPDDKREVKLLDYACGTGSITKALGPFVNVIRGIDISEGMVERYNEAAQSSGLTAEQAKAVVGDLFGEEVPDNLCTPDLYNFDVAVIGLGFHHFENPVLAVERLKERLKAEGAIIIVDFLPFDTENDGANGDMGEMQHTIKHNGFTSTNMEKIFKQAGLENWGFDVLDEPAVMELSQGTRRRKIFIARGRKPPTAWVKVSNWFTGMQDQISDQIKTSTEPAGDPPKSFNHMGGTEEWTPRSYDPFASTPQSSPKTYDPFAGTRN